MVDKTQLNDALSGNYLLVDLQIRSWSGKRTDRTASDQIISSNNASRDSGAFVKNLLASANGELKNVHAASNAIRSFVYSSTLPWSSSVGDGSRRGERLLATMKSMDFLRSLQDIKREYDTAVIALVNAWPSRVAEAMQNLGGLAKAEDYPSAAELPHLFGITIDMKPVPAVGDFSRLNVPAELADALGQRHIAQAEIQVTNAMNDLRDRLITELKRIEVQLGKHGKGEKTRLYDSLITNMQGLVDLARNMNVTGSPKLAELADKIESQILQQPLEVYKNSPALAEAAAIAAREIAVDAATEELFN